MRSVSSFEVRTETLLDAAGELWSVASTTRGVSDDFNTVTGGVPDACGNAEAADAFASLRSSWSAALSGLTDALTAYERNTETAAVLYEEVDRSVLPSTPPPEPPPTDLFGDPEPVLS